MHCTSKWCSVVQATAQFTVAVAVAWAAFIVNEHMTTWSEALSKGADDIHQIRLSMEKIDASMGDVSQEMRAVNMRMDHMNRNMGNIKRRMSPRSWMPF